MTLTAPQLSAIGNYWDKNGEIRYYVNNIQKLIEEKIPTISACTSTPWRRSMS